MTIYTPSGPVLPYVYRCIERETGKFYIGYRYRNYVRAEDDLGTFYFTSNKYVQTNFHKFDWEIVAEFYNKRDAFRFETDLIKETKCENQINAIANSTPKRPYQPSKIHLYCKFPGCGKYINSSIKKFCCQSHASRYSALKGHGKI